MLSLKYLQIIQNPVHCWLNTKWSTFTEVFPQLLSSSTSVFTSPDPPSNNTLEIKSDTHIMKSHCYLHITVQIHGVNPATYRTQHFPCVPTALRQPSTKLVAGCETDQQPWGLHQTQVTLKSNIPLAVPYL